MSAARLIITGKVQAVGYRAWAVREAQRRSLRGWTRNRADGTVEILAIGDPIDISSFTTACRQGPSYAKVESVDRSPAEDDGSEGFKQVGSI